MWCSRPLPVMMLALILFILLYPILWVKETQFSAKAKFVLKLMFFVSLCLLFLSHYPFSWSQNLLTPWLTFNAPLIYISIRFDLNSLLFMTVAFFVSWNILEFSIWYMDEEPKLNDFLKHLLIFLMAMVILVSSGNLVTMFIGWEGIGLLSYLLIGWYHTRELAAIGATQAILYNRIGDIGFLMAMCWMFMSLATLNFESLSHINMPSTTPIIALVLAASSKSALFGFHPWLVTAMEGPTPVSALLHSSTMVIAGIFLMFRISPLVANNQSISTLCMCLGALSTFYAATLALSQHDIKKVIAYSTSSQLGLMMVAIGLGQPNLALFHICAHAFFKAMLFLCAGLFIHVLKGEQDIRMMGGLHNFFPISTACFSIGSFALMGTPFLSAFFSKDAIIESMNTSIVNTAALYLTLTATAFTAIYSVRLIFYTSFSFNRVLNPTVLMSERQIMQAVKPIIRLTCGSIIGGWLMSYMLFPASYPTLTMPSEIKTTALMITIAAFIVAINLIKLSRKAAPYYHFNPHTFNPFNATGLFHQALTQALLDVAERFINFLVEVFFFKSLIGHLTDPQYTPIRDTFSTQSGMIKAYLATLLLSIMVAMMLSSLIPY